MYAKIIDKRILNSKQDVKDFKESIDKLSFKVNKEKKRLKREKKTTTREGTSRKRKKRRRITSKL